MIKRIKKEDYRNYPAVNNSAWNYLLPECGGSPKRFHAYMNGLFPSTESDAMWLGTLIHEYLENPDTFHYSSFTGKEPTAKLKEVIDMVIDIVPPHVTNISAAKDAVIEIAEKLDYGQKWSEATIINKVVEFEDYYTYAKGLPEGCHRLDSGMANKLGAIISNLEMNNDWYRHPSKAYGMGWELETEVPLVMELGGVEYKCLIDRLLVNHTSEEIAVQEIKSVSMPIATYVGGWTYRDFQTGELKSAVGEHMHRYVHRQLSFYKKLARLLFPKYKYRSDFESIHVIETTFPFEYKEHRVSEEAQSQGLDLVNNGMILTGKAMEHMII